MRLKTRIPLMLVSAEMGDSGLEAKTVQVVDAVLVVAVISLQNFSHHLDEIPLPSLRGVHVWGSCFLKGSDSKLVARREVNRRKVGLIMPLQHLRRFYPKKTALTC